jgi:N-acetylglucosamine kinase-like BadF-type ATPase
VALVLGIDAGGSRTVAALAEYDRGELRVLARAEAGSTKLLRVTEEHALRVWQELLGQLAAQARVSLLDVHAACAGLSGHKVERVRSGAHAMLRALSAGEIVLCGDEEIALEAAFGGAGSSSPDTGVLVIAGTGSHAVTCAGGVDYHAGGWGPVLGDEGGGHWIGHQAVRQALRARDERIPSLLLDRIAEVWDCRGAPQTEDKPEVSAVAEMVSKAHAVPAPDFAALAPLVNQCAADGDLVAVRLLHQAGEELARLASLAWAQTGVQTGDDPGATVRVGWTGSVLREMTIVRDAMRAALWVQMPQARLDESPVDPVMGALRRAAQKAGK